MAQSVNAAARRAFRITGIKEVQAQLSKLVQAAGGQAAGADIKEVNLKAALELRNEARNNAPVVTGNLRRAIFAARGDTNKPSALVGVNYKIAGYAHLVEFGHAGPKPAGPRPYMRPAVASTRDRIRKIIADGFGEIVQRYTK